MFTRHNPIAKRIDFLDERFYTADGQTFYPSVTTVLDSWPKGAHFYQWLKDLGNGADQVRDRAAESGTKVHDAIERYLGGEEIKWADENGYAQYSKEEWAMILRFAEFWETEKPTLIGAEMTLVSDTYKLGGTVDIVCELRGLRYLIDTKTGNAIYDTHGMQTAAYSKMWDEQNPEHKIDRVAIMHLKALTKGPDRKGKTIQGKGWKLHEFDESIDENWQSFCDIRRVWDRCNPDYRPKNLTVPDRISIYKPKMIASVSEGVLVEEA